MILQKQSPGNHLGRSWLTSFLLCTNHPACDTLLGTLRFVSPKDRLRSRNVFSVGQGASEQYQMVALEQMLSFAFLLFVRMVGQGVGGQVWPRAGHTVGAQTVLVGRDLQGSRSGG